MEKAIIYLRTSTKEQNPELQRKDCEDFCEKMSLEIVDTISEQGSAYKLDKVRPKWISVQERAKKEKLNIVIWRYDRCFRNRKEFFDFMKVMFEVYGKKVYSATEPSIISFWNMMDSSKTDNPIFNELLTGIFKAMWDFMIQQAGEEAEEESRKKSMRIKLAVRKENGVTKSYKGGLWGRKRITNKKMIEDIIRIHAENPKLTYKQITEQVYYYKGNNKKQPSTFVVFNILKEHRENNLNIIK